MIDVKDFFESLQENDVTKFFGVPDSLLKNICAYISDFSSDTDHLITSNEGSAVALAAGHYLATGRVPLVYMQNSGFGNAINPLLSLADPEVYGIPMLIMVGWRGEPGIKDEPQHIKQGKIMLPIIEACGLDCTIFDKDSKDYKTKIRLAIEQAKTNTKPHILLIKKDTFGSYIKKNLKNTVTSLSREQAIDLIISSADPKDLFISTTGMASRELFELRSKKNHPHYYDFLTVGSMGHASIIALGISQNTKKPVFCIDGDGAAIMHLGNMTSIGQSQSKNLIHIILNNAAHDSVGGQPTSADSIDLPLIAKACGYRTWLSIDKAEEIASKIKYLKSKSGPHFLEIKISKGSRKDLGRPTVKPSENKEDFMQNILI